MDAGEKYPAIVNLWKSEVADTATLQSNESKEWCSKLGISVRTLRAAADYCNFKEREPTSNDIAPKYPAIVKLYKLSGPDKTQQAIAKRIDKSQTLTKQLSCKIKVPTINESLSGKKQKDIAKDYGISEGSGR